MRWFKKNTQETNVVARNLEAEQKFVSPGPFNTAVLFLVFNRPATTARVFEAIRQAKPPRLYVAGDGPCDRREGEAKKIAKVREIATAVDWPCEVKTLFREKNLGCKDAVSNAITWFFEHEEQGIILEDDCLPHPSFFRFCEELLMRYKDDCRVGMISGRNSLGVFDNISSSYHFSTGGGIWGWATWNRVVKGFDLENPEFKSPNLYKYLKKATSDPAEARHLTDMLKQTQLGLINTWDYQWGVYLKLNKLLAVVPSKNLVKNIGFDGGGTHLTVHSSMAEVDSHDMKFPMVHPTEVVANIKFSQALARTYLPSPFISLIQRYPVLHNIARMIVKYLRHHK